MRFYDEERWFYFESRRTGRAVGLVLLFLGVVSGFAAFASIPLLRGLGDVEFTRVYTQVSIAVFHLTFVAGLLYLLWKSKVLRRKLTERVQQLRRRDDLQALYSLVDLLDLLWQPRKGNIFHISPLPLSVDTYEIRVALREKTERVMKSEPKPLTVSPQDTQRAADEQKIMWLEWVNAHERELCEYLAPIQDDSDA